MISRHSRNSGSKLSIYTIYVIENSCIYDTCTYSLILYTRARCYLVHNFELTAFLFVRCVVRCSALKRMKLCFNPLQYHFKLQNFQWGKKTQFYSINATSYLCVAYAENCKVWSTHFCCFFRLFSLFLSLDLRCPSGIKKFSFSHHDEPKKAKNVSNNSFQ